MKILIIIVSAFCATVALFQNCSKPLFSVVENPVTYKSESESLNTLSISENEFYKVVLVVDSSNSMSDELVKLSNSLDQIIEAAKGYNIKFYVYNTDAMYSVAYNGGFKITNPNSTMAEISGALDFALKSGQTISRKFDDHKLNDWSSAQYSVQMKPALAVFELQNNSSDEDIFKTKEKLRELVTKIQPLNVQSNEYGICTLKRILAEEGPNRILFPGDKVNFILISDENNRLSNENDGRCSIGGVVTKHSSEHQDKWCLSDYYGSGGQRKLFNANDCNKLNNKSVLLEPTKQMSISAVMLVKERRVVYSYKHIDSILSTSLERVVDYNYDAVVPSESACTESDLIQVKKIVQANTGSDENLLTCMVKIQNNGMTQPLSSFSIQLTETDSTEHQNLIKSTFMSNHCNEKSLFFDSLTRKLHTSYKEAIADRLTQKGIQGVNSEKLAFARCGQLLSIEHLGVGSENPLAFEDVPDSATLQYVFPQGIKSKADALLGSKNYMVSSYHHSVDLDKNICTMDPQSASYGTEQESMIRSLGENGHKESICSEDYSKKLSEFAKKFTKDQTRTFVMHKFKENSELTSILINGKEIIDLENSYNLIGNKITFDSESVQPGDTIEVFFRHPETI